MTTEAKEKALVKLLAVQAALYEASAAMSPPDSGAGDPEWYSCNRMIRDADDLVERLKKYRPKRA